MSKKVSLIIIAVILMLALVIPSSKVYAANKKVNEVNASQKNGKITVSGSVEDGMLAVAVQVLDSNGKLVKLETGAVNASNKYSLEIEVPEGTYTVKVADYEGGAFAEKTVTKATDSTEKEEDTTTKDDDNKTEDSAKETKTENEENKKGDNSNNPQTGDTIKNTFVVLGAAIVVLALTFKYGKKKRVRKH